MKLLTQVISCLLVLSLSIVSAQSDPVADSAREILEKHKGSLVVVVVEGTMDAKTDGDPLPTNPLQRTTLGVTIGDDGLIVVSNSAIDTSVGLEGQQAKMDDKIMTIRTAKVTYTKVEISYGDSTVLTGKIVRQDVDADVAFILPDQEEAKNLGKDFSYVDLSEFAATAQAGDQVIGMGRASAVYGYMPIVTFGRITGVFKADRTYFATEASSAQGAPIFTLDGKPVGITVGRIVGGKQTGILGTLSAGSIQIMAQLARESGN